MPSSKEEPPRQDRPPLNVPAGLRGAAVAGACLLVIAFTVYLVVQVLVRLAPLTLAIVAALLLTALVSPVSAGLRRMRAPAWLAALAGTLTPLLALALPLALIGNQVVGQWSSLRRQVEEGLDRVHRLVVDGPLPVSERQMDDVVTGILEGAKKAAPDPVGGATAAAEVATAFLLTLLLLFFLLKDGREMAQWALRLAPVRHRGWLAVAAAEGWRTLVSYIRGTFAVAGVDAIGIGIALVVIGVPLALPLTLLTFIAAFVPIVGATVAGAVAVLVALVGNGVTDALLVLGAVILVQQAEGHLLQPLIMGRALSLHPVAILVAVTAGTLLGGVAGAVVAVPITAITYRVALSLRGMRRTEPLPDG